MKSWSSRMRFRVVVSGAAAALLAGGAGAGSAGSAGSEGSAAAGRGSSIRSPGAGCGREGDGCATSGGGSSGTCVGLPAGVGPWLEPVCLERRCGGLYLVESLAGEEPARVVVLGAASMERVDPPAEVVVDGSRQELRGGEILPAGAEVAVAGGGRVLLRRAGAIDRHAPRLASSESGGRFARLEAGRLRVLEQSGCDGSATAGVEAPGLEVAPLREDGEGAVAAYSVWADPASARSSVEQDPRSDRVLVARTPGEPGEDLVPPGASLVGPPVELNGARKVCNGTKVEFKGEHVSLSFRICALNQAGAETDAAKEGTLETEAGKKCANEANCAAKNGCCPENQTCKFLSRGNPKVGKTEGKPSCTEVRNSTCQPPNGGKLFDCTVLVEKLDYKCGCVCG